MSRPWHEMGQALNELEQELRASGIWAVQRPEARRLQSVAPFCIDTLSFVEWLQWVFLPRMDELVVKRGLLPGAAHLSPMGEQAFIHLGRHQQRLLSLLERIDQLSRKLS